MIEECGAPWPDDERVTCGETSEHREHRGRDNFGEKVVSRYWENTECKVPPPRMTKTAIAVIEKQVKDVGKKVKQHVREQREGERRDRRLIGRPRKSSVTSSTTVDRLDGIEEAHGALEPDFIDDVYRCIDALVNPVFTTDELWDWLDEHECYTEHPKGMSGLLRRMVGDGKIIVVETEQRKSRRTNDSRRLQVYRRR